MQWQRKLERSSRSRCSRCVLASDTDFGDGRDCLVGQSESADCMGGLCACTTSQDAHTSGINEGFRAFSPLDRLMRDSSQNPPACPHAHCTHIVRLRTRSNSCACARVQVRWFAGQPIVRFTTTATVCAAACEHTFAFLAIPSSDRGRLLSLSLSPPPPPLSSLNLCALRCPAARSPSAVPVGASHPPYINICRCPPRVIVTCVLARCRSRIHSLARALTHFITKQHRRTHTRSKSLH